MSKKRIFRFFKWFFGIIFGLILLITTLLYVYKDEICNLVIAEANKHLKAKVNVAKVDLAFWGSFPNLSVDFEEVFIQDTYEGATHLDTLLYTERIRLKFNPMDIWRENYTLKSIEVNPGVLKLKVNEEGVNNFDILKEQSDTLESEGFDLKLKEVDFNDFRFSYINLGTDQEYKTRINEMKLEGAFEESIFTANATSNLQIISARSGNIDMVRNKPAVLNVGVNVNKDSNSVTIPASTIYIANLPFDFNGFVGDSSFHFSLKGKNIQIEDAANNLAMKETESVKSFSGKGEVLFDLNIQGDGDTVQPVSVNCSFGVQDATLTDPSTGITLNKVKLDGVYSNEGGADKEHLHLKDISFATRGGPFRGNLYLTHFANPVFQGDADGSLNLVVVKSLFNVPGIKTMNGTVDVHSDFKVQGIVSENGETDYHIDKCEGNVQLHDVNVQLVNDKRVFEKINGRVYLRNNEAGVQDASLRLGGSDMTINGVFKHVVDYFAGKGDLAVNVSVSSNKINLDKDLGTDTEEQKTMRERRYILPDNVSGNVFLEVNKMIYDGHAFENLKGNMAIGERVLSFPRVSVQNGGADIRGSVKISERSPEIFHISSKLTSNNLNFKKLFKEWDNFKQEVIYSHNISGNVRTNVSFDAPFDMRSGIMSSAIVAKIGLQIDDGRLKGVETFRTIIKSLKGSGLKSFIGKDNIDDFGRKLEDLKFDQMKNTILIKNGVITLPSMTIKSSALDVEVAGTHTFENDIDYKFAFYLRDLKKTKDSEFGEVMDDGLGLNVFMRMSGKLDNPTIKWDKESRKEKTKAYNQQEKKNLKSMMKSEFGLFKNDTTVKAFSKDDQPTEELLIEFDPVNGESGSEEVEEKKKKKRRSKLLEKWEKESKKKEEDLEFDWE